MRNVLEAAFEDIGVTDDGGKFPAELRGVNNTRRLLASLRKWANTVVDEMFDMNTQVIDKQTKIESLREDNSRLRDRLAKIEGELRQINVRHYLEQNDVVPAHRVKVLELVK